MLFKEIRKKIEELLEFIETLPEQYRIKTYEVLLPKILNSDTPAQPTPPRLEKSIATPEEFTIPIDVRVFCTKFDISEENLWKLFLISDQEIRSIYKIKTLKKAIAVIQIACLEALGNALRGGKFEFSVEEVRRLAQEHKCYDKTNFSKALNRNKHLFKSFDEKEHIELSPDGKAKLADVIAEITK